jgi:hypothetical protein
LYFGHFSQVFFFFFLHMKHFVTCPSWDSRFSFPSKPKIKKF